MATLTETAYYSRKIIRWGIIALIGLTILRITLSIVINAIRQAFPPPPLKPNNAFGKLPKLDFPESASPSAKLEFTLQTIEGTVPEASAAARIYFKPKERANLLSLSNAQTFVGRMGFTTTPRQLADTKYRWLDLRAPLRTVEMDIVSRHFTLSYAYREDLGLFEEKQIPSPLDAIEETRGFFQNIGITLADLDVENSRVTYLKLVGDQLEPTTSQSTADAVQIDLFRKNYDGMPVLTADPDTGIVTLIISGSRDNKKKIIYVNYEYWPVDINSQAIYKLKTSSEAWQELVSGQGFYANFGKNQNQIPITGVYLAYFDSRESQIFLQPIFVFVGENDFIGYVSAVAPPWIE